MALTALHGRRIDGAHAAAQRGVGSVMTALGYGFSVDKHVGTGLRVVFGGVETDLRELMARGVISVAVSERRQLAIAALCDDALARCSAATAATITGKVVWLTCWSSARALRAVTQPVRVRAASEAGDDTVTPALRASLEFLRDVLPQAPPRVIELGSMADKPVLVWSDAMFQPGAVLEDGGGFVVIKRRRGAEPFVFVGCGATQAEVRALFTDVKKTYIGELEGVWAHSPYASLPTEFVGARVLHWIDNTGCCSWMIKGCAACIDASKIVMAQTAKCVELQCAPFYQYVNTKANIGDFPSRFDLAALFAVLRAVGLERRVVWVTPVMPNIASWRLAASALLRSLGVPAYVPMTLSAARGKWRHFVLDARTHASWRQDGAVYCGCRAALGAAGFGNVAPGGRPAPQTSGAARAIEWERCVRVYARWLAAPAREYLRRIIRVQLRRRFLVCHCSGSGLPCHAEVIAAWANELCLPCSALVAA